MKKQNVLRICFAVVFLLGSIACSFNALAADKTPEQKAYRKGLQQGLENSPGGYAGSQRISLVKDDARFQGGIYLGFRTCGVN